MAFINSTKPYKMTGFCSKLCSPIHAVAKGIMESQKAMPDYSIKYFLLPHFLLLETCDDDCSSRFLRR